MIAANLTEPAVAPDGAVQTAAPDPAAAREAFITAMLAEMERDPQMCNRAVAMTLFYVQEIYFQQLESVRESSNMLAQLKEGGIGGIVKMLRGK